MPYFNVGEENDNPINLFYEDHGSGRPVVLIHGWPLSNRSWEKQESALLEEGYRVIRYDRRGFGQSDQPGLSDYNYDILARDLDCLMRMLELEDAALVGFSMGGGEVARYLARFGSKRVSHAVFISSVPPFLLKTADNPEGVDAAVFEKIKAGIVEDRPAFLKKFLSDFYTGAALAGKKVSDEVLQLNWMIAAMASPKATLDCVSAWLEDFRPDLAKIKIPTLVIHGDHDRIVPIEVSGQRTQKLIPGAELYTVAGGPHGILWTHADEVNKELIRFLEK